MGWDAGAERLPSAQNRRKHETKPFLGGKARHEVGISWNLRLYEKIFENKDAKRPKWAQSTIKSWKSLHRTANSFDCPKTHEICAERSPRF